MRWLDNQSVYFRIGVLGGLCVLAVVALSATIFYATGATDRAIEREQAFTEIERVSLEIEVGALQMRRREKDFIMRRDPSYLDRYLADAEQVGGYLDQLASSDAGSEIAAAVGRLQAALPEHRAAFEHVVNEQVRLGVSPSEGLEGSLRSAVRAAETRLGELEDSELTVLMLMMRRHEKDFMLRVQDRYITRFDTRQVEFADLLAQRDYSQATKDELTTLMASYSRDFHAWAGTRLAYTDSISRLSEIFAGMSPDFDVILEAASAGSEAAHAQFAADQARTQMTLIAAIIVILALSGACTWIVGRSIVAPIKRLTQTMSVLADGDTSCTVPATDQTDEIGRMAQSVLVFQNNLIEMERLKAEQAKSEAARAEEKRQAMNDLADAFDDQIGKIANDVAFAATSMISCADQMHGSAQNADERSSVVASAAEETSANTQSVASATEELTSSIHEIRRQVKETMELMGEAVSETESTQSTITGLADAAGRIGEVITLISTIADQTNLLALNATIEASRAGDAGKGFAVVASEVKALADQTGKATLEIADQIEAMQKSGQDAVTAIASMGQIIDRVSNGSTAIASAVEQQNSAANEIATSVSQAASGTAQVTESITALSGDVRETDEAAGEVLNAARAVSADADRLKAELSEFLGQVRSA